MWSWVGLGKREMSKANDISKDAGKSRRPLSYPLFLSSFLMNELNTRPIDSRHASSGT